MQNPFEEFFRNISTVGKSYLQIDFYPMPLINNPLNQNRKLKAFALLYWPKDARKWWGRKIIEPKEVRLVLTSAFDLEEAARKCEQELTIIGVNINNFILVKWVSLDYDQLFPGITATPSPAEILNKLTEILKIPEKKPAIIEKESGEKKTPFEQFIYNIKFLMDKANADTDEREVISRLIERFRKRYD